MSQKIRTRKRKDGKSKGTRYRISQKSGINLVKVGNVTIKKTKTPGGSYNTAGLKSGKVTSVASKRNITGTRVRRVRRAKHTGRFSKSGKLETYAL